MPRCVAIIGAFSQPSGGIHPCPITADGLTRMLGDDERVSAASLEQSTQMTFKIG